MIDLIHGSDFFSHKIYIFLFFSSLYSSLAQQQTAAAALSAHHPFGVQPPHPYQQVCLFTYFFFAKSNELKKIREMDFTFEINAQVHTLLVNFFFSLHSLNQ